jgi:cyanuric acid amidohydrolase
MPVAKLHRISASAPDDVSGIEAAIAGKRINPQDVIAVLGKTEGNGLVNDFSRGFATLALKLLFLRYLAVEEAEQICLIMSGGTEGGMAPHWIVFERGEGADGERPALAIGRAHTAQLPFEHLGRMQQVDQVAAGVRAAMLDACIVDAGDVHFVQIKCPLLTVARIGDAARRGATVAAPDTLKSMGLSRAASALGAAVALGEINRAELKDAEIGTRWDLWSARASSSAGIELLGHEIVVLGMSGSLCLPRRRPVMTAGCAVIATPCSMIPMWRPHVMRGPLSAARLQDSWGTPRFTFLAAPSTRARTGEDQWH